MRIVAGIYGGRRLNTPPNNAIRPTSDKVRGAIFNALVSMGVIDGAYVLDAFCGTGALGLEAMSRGAAGCMFSDKDPASLRLAQENAEMLSCEAVSFKKGSAAATALYATMTQRFDLVFIDPPYNKGLAQECLDALHASRILSAGAVCVIEAEKSFAPIMHGAYAMHSEKAYGDSKIWILRYNAVTDG